MLIRIIGTVDSSTSSDEFTTRNYKVINVKIIFCSVLHVSISCSLVAREQYLPRTIFQKWCGASEKRYSTHHMDASTLHSDEGRSQLR